VRGAIDLGLVLALVPAAAACTPVPPPASPDAPRNRMTPSSSCAESIAALASGDLGRVHGLPASCTLADVATTLAPLDGEGLSALGEPPVDHRIHYFRGPRLSELVEVWLAGDRVALVDIERPMTPRGWQAFVEPLGPPEARLDYTWSKLVLPGAEWVWPSRGIVAVVKENVGLVLRAGVFVPGTLADYRRTARYAPDERDEPGD
jgi:hypothetical protein